MDKKQFMNAIYGKDKELNEFLLRNFYIINRNKPNWRDRFKKIFTKDYTTKRHTQREVDRKVKLLEQLTVGEKKVAKARLKQLEENNDVSKFFPSIIAITAALFVAINTISTWIIKAVDLKISDQKQKIKESGNSLKDFDSLAILKEDIFLLLPAVTIAIVLIVYLSYKISKNSNYRNTAIYTNSLLQETLTDKK